jgi:GlpG protein
MRELGTSPNAEQASILVDYLLTQNIPALARVEEGRHEVWIRNEDDQERAHAIWTEFQTNPHDSKYIASRKPAREIRKKSELAEKKYASLYQDAYDFWGRPAPSRVPLTMGLIVISIVVSFWSEFGKNPKVTRWLSFTDRPVRMWLPQEEEEADGAEQLVVKVQTEAIRRGEFWRVITPIFLHFSFFHLLFNAYALFSLGGLIEYRRGVWWMLLFVLVTGVVSNTLQFFLPTWFQFDPRFRGVIGSGIFGGLSGVVYAVFGYLLAKTSYDREPGLHIPNDTIYMLLIWLVVCMTGWFGAIGNTAHVAGFVCGFVIGATPKAWRQLTSRK